MANNRPPEAALAAAHELWPGHRFVTAIEVDDPAPAREVSLLVLASNPTNVRQFFVFQNWIIVKLSILEAIALHELKDDGIAMLIKEILDLGETLK